MTFYKPKHAKKWWEKAPAKDKNYKPKHAAEDVCHMMQIPKFSIAECLSAISGIEWLLYFAVLGFSLVFKEFYLIWIGATALLLLRKRY